MVLAARSPRSHYDVILIHSLLSWSRPLLWTYERTDTLPRLIYKDVALVLLYNYNTGLILGTLPNFFKGQKTKVLKWWLHTAK